jgi:signal transduction histidine kinase
MRAWWQRVLRAPARLQIRGAVVVLLVLSASIMAAAVITANAEQRVVRRLTLAVGPAFQYNNDVLLRMTEARAAWRESLLGTGPVGTPEGYAGVEAEAEGLLASTATALGRDEISAAQRQRYRTLVEAQRDAVGAWFDAARDAEVAARSAAPNRQAAADLAAERFSAFRAANRDLDTVVRSQRDESRALSRNSVWIVLGVLLAGALLVAVVVVVTARLIGTSLIAPLGHLRRVLTRQREGDDSVHADEATGAAEVRALAADYNELTRVKRALQEEQAQTLLVHRLTLDVARRVRGIHDIGAALHLVCASLGEGLAVDRVLLHTIGEDGQPDGSAQFHRYDLPPLPPLPPSLMGQVAAVNDELRREATVFRLPDLLDPAVAADPRVAAYHRATGARSLLMVPIGVGEKALGLLALMTVELPRRWRRYEIQGVQQCVAHVAQAIVSSRLAEMQAEQVDRLTELDRQKTDFMATVSHELRTPLTSISGYLELLEDGDYGLLSGPQLGALKVIERNTTRLRGLIEDLLVLNRIETSGLNSSPQDTPVSDLVAGVVELLRPVAANGRVELEAQPAPEDLCVHVDRTQFERALINLGSNAVKFTPAGGTVRISAERSGSRVAISVSDTGIGIPHEDLQQLGNRFFRASNATAKAIPGTGLGLAIVRTIVEGHGGQMFVASAEGEGTTVRLFLPSATAGEPAAGAPAAGGPAAGEATPRPVGNGASPSD